MDADGAFAETCVADERSLAALPDGLGFEQGAAIMPALLSRRAGQGVVSRTSQLGHSAPDAVDRHGHCTKQSGLLPC
jgi:hypothetical protein